MKAWIVAMDGEQSMPGGEEAEVMNCGLFFAETSTEAEQKAAAAFGFAKAGTWMSIPVTEQQLLSALYAIRPKSAKAMKAYIVSVVDETENDIAVWNDVYLAENAIEAERMAKDDWGITDTWATVTRLKLSELDRIYSAIGAERI